MSALICGSIAFDNIMNFEGRFHEHIIPEQLQMLNISFPVPDVRRGFGGCGANIAYSLKLLGGDGRLMGTVGSDFSPYAAWMDKHAIDRRYVLVLERHLTAAAYIISDADGNQITAFHAGAMDACHLGKVPSDDGVRIGVVSPEGREGMLAHARQFSEAGIPYLFDPGQGTHLFDCDELLRFVEGADWAAFNEYEASLVARSTGISIEKLSERVRALIVTHGRKGSVIYASGKAIEIPVAAPKRVKDPTGCGDAYRAGLIYGLQHDMDWQTVGRVASLMGAIKVESSGTQQHRFTRDEFDRRFRDSFAYAL